MMVSHIVGGDRRAVTVIRFTIQDMLHQSIVIDALHVSDLNFAKGSLEASCCNCVCAILGPILKLKEVCVASQALASCKFTLLHQ